MPNNFGHEGPVDNHLKKKRLNSIVEVSLEVVIDVTLSFHAENLIHCSELTWYNSLFVKFNSKFLSTYIPLNKFKWGEFKVYSEFKEQWL